MPTDNTEHNKSKGPKPKVINIGKIPKVNIAEDKEANAISREANTISRLSFYVNGFLVVCTIGLAYYAFKQADSAKDAAKTAHDTFVADTTNSGKVYRQSRIDAEANEKREDDRDQRASQLFELQKKSIEQVNDQFVKQNEPLLQFIPDEQRGVEINGNSIIKIYYRIRNIAKIPIQVIRSDVKIYPVGNNINSSIYFKPKMPLDSNGVYYGTGDSPSTFCQYIDPNNSVKKSIEKLDKELLVVGRMEFKNYLNNKIRYYDFIAMWYYEDGSYSCRFLINKNYDIK